MTLIPGVIDNTTIFVEHPQVVARRILEAIAAVGDPARVIAGVDCGFNTFLGYDQVASDVVWEKLASARKGADLAARQLQERARVRTRKATCWCPCGSQVCGRLREGA